MSRSIFHQSWAVTRVALVRLRFVAVFLAAALVVGYWDYVKNYVDRWTRPPVAPDALADAHAGEVEFYCPMHPDVVRDDAGLCPKCGMPLVKRRRGEAVVLPADVLARVQLTPRRIALANVQTSAVEPRPLVREIRALGVLDYDETRLARLSARVAGRADELFVTYTGQQVKRGDPIYSIYSPEVLTAQREYLLSRKRVNDLPRGTAESVRMDAAALYNAALQKLALWGVTKEQLDRLDNEFDRTGRVPDHLTVAAPIGGTVVRKDINQGQYVQVGDAPYTVADLTTLWLQLKLYEQDVPLVALGAPVELTVEAFPGQAFGGAVTFKSFQLDPRTRTLDARVEVKNADLRLRPGMFASAVVRAPVTAAGPTTAPTTMPSMAAPQRRNDTMVAAMYEKALAPYFQAQKLLATDKAEGVAPLIAQSADALAVARSAPAVATVYRRLNDAAAAAKGQDLKALRETFKQVSNAMIDLGKDLGAPPAGPAVRVFRCPMNEANWLQIGGTAENPYYGAEMLDCGTAIETLPRRAADVPAAPAEAVAGSSPVPPVLAVPRSAVIHTGRNEIVYVESAPGLFDMKAVKLGPPAGDYYPVLSGLADGDRVVTVGAFLIDAETRLNPSAVAPQAQVSDAAGAAAHTHASAASARDGGAP